MREATPSLWPMRLTLVLIVLAVVITTCATVSTADAPTTCDPLEGFYMDNGADYRGSVSVTASGHECLSWEIAARTSGVPSFVYPNPTAGISDHNHCRNPDRSALPWCYYEMSREIRRGSCDVGVPCERPPSALSVLFDPPSTTVLGSEGERATVTVRCYPRPCEVYYTLDGSVPSVETGLGGSFAEPTVLSHNTTIKALAVFSNGEQQRRQAVYTFRPAAPSPTPGKYHFIPDPTHVYTDPVLISIDGLSPEQEASTDGHSVLLYRNDEHIPVTYSGPFWLYESTELTAVIDRTFLVSATYTIKPTAPPKPVTVIPPSGTFIGGVRAVVVASDAPHAKYFVSFNGAPYEPLEKLLFTIDATGLTKVAVKVMYIGGPFAITNLNYTIVAAAEPLVHPDPSLTYSQAIEVFCTDPLGKALLLEPSPGPRCRGFFPIVTATRSDAEQRDTTALGEETSPGYYYLCDIPGDYRVGCAYVDSLGVTHTRNSTVVLRAVPLPTPVFDPPCGSVLPAAALHLGLRVRTPDEVGNDSSETAGDLDRFHVSFREITGGRLVFATRTDTLEYAYGVVPHNVSSSTDLKQDLRVTVRAVVSSTSPLEDVSEPGVCTYIVRPRGVETTPLVVARPTVCFLYPNRPSVFTKDTLLESITGATRSDEVKRLEKETDEEEVSPRCLEEVRSALATCLHLYYSTELLAMDVYGAFVGVSVTRLQADMVAVQEGRVVECLSKMHGLQEITRASQGAVKLATQWSMLGGSGVVPTAASLASTARDSSKQLLDADIRSIEHEVSVYSDTPFVVLLSGYNLKSGSYHLVRSEQSCTDIGVAAAAETGDMHLALSLAAVSDASDSRHVHRTHRFNASRFLAGSLSAGADSSGGSSALQSTGLVFSVDSPGSYNLCANIWGAAYRVPGPLVHVLARPFVTLTPDNPDACGGLVDEHHLGVPLITHFTASPDVGDSSLSIWHSFNAYPWHMGARGDLSATIMVPAVTRVHPAQVLSTSVGAGSTATGTCVFYAPHEPPVLPLPPTEAPLEYRFYTLNTTSNDTTVATPQTMVVVTIAGPFYAAAHLSIEVTMPDPEVVLRPNNYTVTLARTAATTAAAVNNSLAVPDHVFYLSPDRSNATLSVYATVDGVRVRAQPALVALSPLALAMWECKDRCASGFCYTGVNINETTSFSASPPLLKTACICITKDSEKSAYICGDAEHEKPIVPKVSMMERVALMCIYFAALAVIGSVMVVMARRGNRQGGARIQGQAHDVVVDPAV